MNASNAGLSGAQPMGKVTGQLIIGLASWLWLNTTPAAVAQMPEAHLPSPSANQPADHSSRSPMTTTTSSSAVDHFRSGQITRAVQQWNQEIRSGNNLVENLFNRSQAYILLEQYESALQDINTIVALEGSAVGPEILLVQGIALSNLNKFTEALESFDRSEQRQPSALVYSNRALVYQRTGQLDQALNDLTKAVELAPTAVNRLNLANLYLQIGEFAMAAQTMDVLIAEDVSFFPAYLSRGIAYFNLADYEPALRDLLSTLRLSPNQPEARYYAGLSLERLNYREEAAQNLVMAADLYLQQNQPNSYHRVLDKMTELGL